MFERFTEQARQVIVLAQEEARVLKHDYIGTEHMLLGLVREGHGLASAVLAAHDLSVESVRARVVEIVGGGEADPHGQIPFTPRAKRMLERSLREALGLGHNHIGTEHLLIALLRDEDGVAVHVVRVFGVEPELLIDDVTTKLLEGQSRERWGGPQAALRKLFQFVSEARAHDRLLHGSDVAPNAYVAGAVNALRDAGLISYEDAKERFDELWRPPDPPASSEFSGANLERLLPAPDQPGDDVRVLGVELYRDGCVVRVAVPSGGSLPVEVLLHDSAGTSYRQAEPVDWHGSDGVVGDYAFVPAVPRSGGELTVIARFKDGRKHSARIPI